MRPYDLSVIIMARNEMFLSRTVEEVLTKRRGNTEVIVVLDGAWADPPIPDHEDVTIIYHNTSIGQRGALNEGVRMSQAKYIMKLDAHCALDEGFDVKLMKDCEYDWTVVPRLYNLHVFDWKCKKCGNQWYQGKTPTHCMNNKTEGRVNKDENPNCDNTTDFERVIIWQPRLSRRTDFMRFDRDLHFQYWGAFAEREEAKGNLAPTMSLLGACFFMHRQRYWDIDGSDMDHGSWGQQGTEISCKSWLSGGKLMVNKNTWYSHLFRTQGGDFGFPYPNPGSQVDQARKRSREMWIDGKWDKAIHPLHWMIEKFWPIPGWDEADLKAIGGQVPTDRKQVSKGIIFYTDNQVSLKIAHAVQKQLKKANLPIVSASLKPMEFGKNVYLPLKRGYVTMATQILSALESSDADVIFFCEHDVLYHPSHFDFTPSKEDVYYYNTNVWKVRSSDGHAFRVDDCKQLSGLCGYRKTLIEHFRKRLDMLEARQNDPDFNAYVRAMGFEPGTHHRAERVDDLGCEGWESDFPNIDIRHEVNLTPTRYSPEEFRNKKFADGWTESDEVQGWGLIKNNFSGLLKSV